MPSIFDDAISGIRQKPVYRDESIALYHADCAKVLAQIQPSKNITVISDPPYGIRWLHSHNPVPILGDDKPFDPSHLPSPAVHGGPGVNAGSPKWCVLFGGTHYHARLPEGGSWLVWDKRCPHCGGAGLPEAGPTPNIQHGTPNAQVESPAAPAQRATDRMRDKPRRTASQRTPLEHWIFRV